MIRSDATSNPSLREPSRLADADRCVMCGLCVPGCPTFNVHRLESRGPRGRIVAMLALRDGRLSPDDPAVLANLDSCTSCGRCEAVCPAKVPYTRLIDDTRAILRQRQPPPLPVRLLRAILIRPGLAGALAAVARGGRAVGLGPRRANRRRSHLWRFMAQIERPFTPRRDRQPAGPVRRVQVFAGCTDAFFQGETLRAIEALTDATGARIEVIRNACCGALHAHSGDPVRGEVQTRACRSTLAGTMRVSDAASTTPCIVLDSGCLLHLHAAEGGEGTLKFQSVSEWLATLDLPRERWIDTPIRVALHTPCTARFGPRAGDDIRRWLDTLPGVKVVAAPDEPACCGAGGLTGLAHPEQAQRMGHATLKALGVADGDARSHDRPHHSRSHIDVIVTTNVGCRIHLGGLQATGSPDDDEAHTRASTQDGTPVVSLARFASSRLKNSPAV